MYISADGTRMPQPRLSCKENTNSKHIIKKRFIPRLPVMRHNPMDSIFYTALKTFIDNKNILTILLTRYYWHVSLFCNLLLETPLWNEYWTNNSQTNPHLMEQVLIINESNLKPATIENRSQSNPPVTRPVRKERRVDAQQLKLMKLAPLKLSTQSKIGFIYIKTEEALALLIHTLTRTSASI